MKRQGFTLIEVLVVIGIIGLTTGMAMPLYRDFQVRSDLNLASDQISQGIAQAKLRSQSGKEDDGWGFHIESGTMFKGSDYATRDTAHDVYFPMPETLGFSGMTVVTFSKLEGMPSATGSITVESLFGERKFVDITISQQALPTNLDDRLTICHCKSNPPQTMSVTDSAWNGHQNHGDRLGACLPNEPRC